MSDSEEMRLGKKAPLLKALAAKNKISRPPPFPCMKALTMGKSLHTIAHRNVAIPLFFHHEGMANRIFWRPKVRSFSASPFFAANILRRQNHGQEYCASNATYESSHWWKNKYVKL